MVDFMQNLLEFDTLGNTRLVQVQPNFDINHWIQYILLCASNLSKYFL